MGSSAVSVIDRAVWWRRRVILFICGFATLILDLAGGVNSFQGIKILADLGDGIQVSKCICLAASARNLPEHPICAPRSQFYLLPCFASLSLTPH